MPYLDPEKRKQAHRRYYASKGKVRRAELYRESLVQTLKINPKPLMAAMKHWGTI